MAIREIYHLGFFTFNLFIAYKLFYTHSCVIITPQKAALDSIQHGKPLELILKLFNIVTDTVGI